MAKVNKIISIEIELDPVGKSVVAVYRRATTKIYERVTDKNWVRIKKVCSSRASEQETLIEDIRYQYWF